MKEYELSEYDSNVIMQDKEMADYFEHCVKLYKNEKKVANWLTGAVAAELNSRKKTISELNLKPKALTQLLESVDKGTVSNLVAKDILTEMIDSGKPASDIVNEKGLAQVSDSGELEKFAKQVISENKKVVEDYKSGKENAIMFLVGQVMRKSKGKANPKVVIEVLKKELKK